MTLRILVASDAVAGLTPRASSELIAGAFEQQGAQVAVLPLGACGAALADALATMDDAAEPSAPATLGEVASLLVPGPGPLVLDLTAMAVPTLDDLVRTWTRERVTAAREALSGRDLVGIVPRGQDGAALAGLAGVIAELGRARGADLAETIRENNRAEAWAADLDADPAAAGSGALGGVGLVLSALGGRVSGGLEFCLDGYRAREVMGQADVVVAGTSQLDFHDLGGPVVKVLSALAADTQRPLVVLAGRTFVSSRELRLAGIEAAYAVEPGAGDEPGKEAWSAAADKVAATWRW